MLAIEKYLTKFIVMCMHYCFISFIFAKRVLLKLLRFVLFFKKAPENFSPDTILVLKIGGLGDFIFGIPSLNLLRDRFPNSKIFLITAKSLNKLKLKYLNRDPLDASELPWIGLVRSSVDEILVVHDLSFQMIKRISNLIPKSNNLGVFILGYPGVTISSVFKKMLFIRLIIKGVAVCVGFDKKFDYNFMRKFQSKQGLYRHKMLGDIDSVMEIFPKESFSEADLDFKVFIKSEVTTRFSESLAINNSKNIIMMAPLATTLHKQWPLENFVHLAKEIEKLQENFEFLLIGTSEQYEETEYVCQKIGFNVKNLCGRLSIEELAALFSIAQGYIGNDGGMSQLAGLMGCPSVIAFNSVEEDWITHPWRSANGVVRNRTECSPCYDGMHCPKGHRKCMTDISVESMMLKVKEIIFDLNSKK